MTDVPDVYADQFTMTQSPYGLSMTFSRTPSIAPSVPGQVPAEAQVVVRMSLEHAKVMTMMLRKRLKQYELEHLGDPIRVPSGLLRQLQLAEEDW